MILKHWKNWWGGTNACEPYTTNIKQHMVKRLVERPMGFLHVTGMIYEMQKSLDGRSTDLLDGHLTKFSGRVLVGISGVYISPIFHLVTIGRNVCIILYTGRQNLNCSEADTFCAFILQQIPMWHYHFGLTAFNLIKLI